MIVGEAFVKIGALVDPTEDQRIAAALGRSTDAAAQTTAQRLTGIGDTLTRRVTPAASAAAAATGLIFREFDRGEDTITATTGAMGDELDHLTDQARDVANVVSTGFGDVATILALTEARLGLTGDRLEEFTRSLVELNELQPGAGTDQILDLIEGFGIAPERAADSLNILLRASQATGRGIAEIAPNAAEARIALESLDLTFEEAVALAAQLGPNFSRALAGIRVAIANLSAAGVQDIPAAFKAAVDGIENAGSAADANRLAIELFGKRAGPGMASLIREGQFAIDELAKALLRDTSTVHETREATRDFSDVLASFRNRVVGLIGPVSEFATTASFLLAAAGPGAKLFGRIGTALGRTGFAKDVLAAQIAAGRAGRDLSRLGAVANVTGRNLGSLARGTTLAKAGLAALALVLIDDVLSAADDAKAAVAGLGNEMASAVNVAATRRSIELFKQDLEDLQDFSVGDLIPRIGESQTSKELAAAAEKVEELRRSATGLAGDERDLVLAQADLQESLVALAKAKSGASVFTDPEDLDRLKAEAAAAEQNLLNLVAAQQASGDTSAATAGAVGALSDSYDALGESTNAVLTGQALQAQLAADLKARIDAQTLAQEDLTQAHQEAADAAREVLSAELSLAQGYLGIQDAALGARDAQQELADAQIEEERLRNRSQVGTVKYREALDRLNRAQLGAVGGQLSLAQSVADYITETQGGEVTAKTAVAIVRDFGDKAGLSGRGVSALIRQVQMLIGQYERVPDSRTTRADFVDDLAREKIAKLKADLDTIPEEVETTVNVGVNQTPITPPPAVGGVGGTLGVAGQAVGGAVAGVGTVTVNVNLDSRKVTRSNKRRETLVGGS